jgi:hypothetical protein
MRAREVACWCALLSACESSPGAPDAAGAPGDAAIVDARVEEHIDDTEADAPRIIECQPGSQQTCRGDDACWGHRNCNDQYKLGDCICETGAGGATDGGATSE